MTSSNALIRGLVRDIPDFPKPGILFKDITPLLANPQGLKAALDALAAPFVGTGVTMVAGMESRGFIFGVSVAERLGVGFVPIRKPGKLPAKTFSESYALEYGTDTLQMHCDAVCATDKVLIIDDLLATGGTASAAIRLVEKAGATVVALSFVIELDFLNGRDRLDRRRVESLLHY